MRIRAIGLLIGMALAWTGAFFFVKTYHDGVAQQAGLIADRIEVPEDWIVVSEHVEREQFVCFNTKPCPTLSRTWQADRVLEATDLQRLTDTLGWDFELDGDCQRGDDEVGVSSVCSAVATSEGYRIQLRVDSPEPGSASMVRLRLTSAGE